MNASDAPRRPALLRLAAWSHDRRREVVLLWFVALILTVGLSQSFGGDFSIEFTTPKSESTTAQDLLKARFPQTAGDAIDVVYRSDAGVADPATRAEIEAFLATATQLGNGHVIGAVSPYSDAGRFQVSADGTIAFASLQLDVGADTMPQDVTRRIVDAAKTVDRPGLQVELGGFAVRQAEQGAIGSEGLGLLAAVFILLLTFGSLLAMGLPILIAIFGLGIGTALMALIANFVQTPSFATQVASMIGIGVGIDYVLFITTRYRSELHRGHAAREAIITSIGTAGRAVLFAGCTVIISLLGLFVIGLKFLQGVAISSAAGVAVVMFASVTLLPALLGFIGERIDRFKVPFVKTGVDDAKGFWYRWSRIVQRHPAAGAIAGLSVLLVLAAPMLSIRFGFPDAGNDKPGSSAREAYDLQSEGFGPGYNGPLFLVAELPPGVDAQPALTALVARVGQQSGVAAVTPPFLSPDGSIALIRAIPTTSPQDQATDDLVRTLRKDVLPAATAGTGITVSIGGNTAATSDISDYLSERLPIFIATVVLLSFVLLLVVFRAPLVAIKAAVMNVLSIVAAYGVVGYAMQGGWLGGLIGIHEAGPLAPFIPMMMFAILFGLSMDYEVFLLSRVREEYMKTGDNGLAVADGLAQTARVITAAAAIMVAVFLSFVLGDDVMVKAIGIGMAAAILVDATIVRLVLVPSTMELLGDANWWIPKWLDRILPELHIEGQAAEDERDDLDEHDLDEHDIDAELSELVASDDRVTATQSA